MVVCTPDTGRSCCSAHCCSRTGISSKASVIEYQSLSSEVILDSRKGMGESACLRDQTLRHRVDMSLLHRRR